MIDNRIYLASIFLRDNLLIFNHQHIQDILIISKVLTHVIYIHIGAGVDNIRHYVIIRSSHLYLPRPLPLSLVESKLLLDVRYRSAENMLAEMNMVRKFN